MKTMDLYREPWAGLGNMSMLRIFSIFQGGPEHWFIGLAFG